MGGVSLFVVTLIRLNGITPVEFKMHLSKGILNLAAVLKVNSIVRYFSL